MAVGPVDIVLALLGVILLLIMLSVRDEVRRQTDVLEAIGRNAGWLPPRR